MTFLGHDKTCSCHLCKPNKKQEPSYVNETSDLLNKILIELCEIKQLMKDQYELSGFLKGDKDDTNKTS